VKRLLLQPSGASVIPGGARSVWKASYPSLHLPPMKTSIRILLAASVAAMTTLAAGPAFAQWGWKEGGRTVFSDQPPPAGVPAKDIIRRPPGSRAPIEAGPTASTAASGPSGTPTASTSATGTSTAAAPARPASAGKDSELEKKKKEADAKKEAEKKVEEQKQAAARSENCERARRAKTTFDSGQRVSTTNAKGEREIMDEATRAAEVKRLEGIIASDCK
jgi:hypothetical protein